MNSISLNVVRRIYTLPGRGSEATPHVHQLGVALARSEHLVPISRVILYVVAAVRACGGEADKSFECGRHLLMLTFNVALSQHN